LGFVYVYREGELGRGFVGYAQVAGDGSFATGPIDTALRYDLLATGFDGFRSATLLRVSPTDPGIVVALARGGRIAGRVVRTDGGAVPAGVPVGVCAEGTTADTPASRLFAYTQEGGAFSVDGLGDFEFTVEAGGGLSGFLAPEPRRAIRPGTTDLVLEVVLGAEVTGTLVGSDGEPVSTPSLSGDDGARVGAMRPYCQVGSDGRFVLRGLRPGRVRLAATIGGTFLPLGEVDAPASDLRVNVPE
jgi:hypothetical protein